MEHRLTSRPHSRVSIINLNATMQAPTTFAATHRASIEALRDNLSSRLQCDLDADYGDADCGLLDAALCVNSLPWGSFGAPGPLVSILAGNGAGDGYAVMGADGSSLAHGVTFARALQCAKFAAVREWREKTKGALQAA